MFVPVPRKRVRKPKTQQKAYDKEKKRRNVPISPELQTVLNELKAEQKKVSSISGRVFTRHGRPIKSIRTAFEEARKKAGIEDLHFQDFRHYMHNPLGITGNTAAGYNGCGWSSLHSAKQ